MRRLARILPVLAILAAPAAVSAQVRAGGELAVNVQTAGGQVAPKVAVARDGSFVVAWMQAAQYFTDYDVYARRFASTGAPIGLEFRVNTSTTGKQMFPDVAVDEQGDFVIVWYHYPSSFPRQDFILGQRYDRSGRPRGGEFQVNGLPTNGYGVPRVATTRGGRFIVVWDALTSLQPDYGIAARLFGADGDPRGLEFLVDDAATTDRNRRPVVAAGPEGDFVVAWQSYHDPARADVKARRFARSGAPLGAEFRVNSYTTEQQDFPSVAMDPTGAFVVAWGSWQQDGDFEGVYAQRYDAFGATLGGELQVNAFTTRGQDEPAVAIAEDGSFVIAWHGGGGQDGSGYGVFAQRFDAQGARRGAEFLVNTYTTGAQVAPDLASDRAGNFTAVWASADQDGDDFGVFGQRFGGVVPAALSVDTPGNRVLEPGEAVDVRPSWRNVNGAPQAMSGTFTGISGPTGMTYAILDGSGDYGTIPNAAIGPCADCYSVFVSDPPLRPALHVDASALERLAPDVQGQVKRWALHVGGSFADVAPASVFYPFVEALLHHGVTGGCTSAAYCPLSLTSREQMAVFVLVGREGDGYAPRACGAAPVFADVPASSPFCPWVEELARRGVVGGCGGGNYCPTGNVTREQMSVFVLRTLDETLSPPACVAGAEMFADVPAGNPFCRWIEELARRGVVTGCGGGNYCPVGNVTREQMGVFITVTFGLALYGP